MTDSTVPPDQPATPDQPGPPSLGGGSPEPEGQAAAGGVEGGWSSSATIVPAAPEGRSRRKGLVVGAVVVGAAAIVAAGGVAAYAFLSGGGTQPEDVVSADAVAFLKLDLDPAAGQKVALARLAQRLDAPLDPAEEADSPQAVFARLLGGLTGADVDYDRDLKAWIGARAAVAGFPQSPSGGEPGALITVATTDEAAATEALNRLYPADSGWTVAVRDGFAFVGDPTTTAPAERVLADDETFVGATDALGDTIAMVYVDVDATLDAAEATLPLLEDLQQGAGPSDPPITDDFFAEELGEEGLDPLGLLTDQFDTIRQQLAAIPSPIGGKAIAFGLAVQPDAVELRARAFGLTEATDGSGTALVMGSDAVAFLAVDGVGQALSNALDQAGDAVAEFDDFIDPQQFVAALGSNVQVQVGVDSGGEPLVLGRISGGDASFWQGLGGLAGLEVTTDGDAVVLGQPGASEATGEPGGESRILSLLPEAAEADLVGYVDVKAVQASSASAEVEGQLAQISEAGFTVSTPTDGDSSLRLVVRFDSAP